MPRRWALAASVVALFSARAAEVAWVGGALTTPEVARHLQRADLRAERVDAAELARIDPAVTRVIVLAEDKSLPPESRVVLSRFLARGGHVVVVGAHAFDYAPRPVRAVELPSVQDQRAVRMVKPERKGTGRKSARPEPARRENVTTPDGRPAVVFRTYLRGMDDFLLEFDATAARSAARTVVQFWAKGDAYMDLLALEVRDTQSRRWLGFVPLSSEWKQHAISLADFIPDGWAQADVPYPLLDPASVATIGLGTNLLALWTEKPMSLALGPVALAESETGIFAPTSALPRLRLPFFENGIKTPSWLFDPFAGTAPVAAKTLRHAGANETIASPDEQWLCPPPFVEHPGPRMGSDHHKDYMLKFVRETRRTTLWEALDAGGASLGAIAETRIFATGPHKGASVALFAPPIAAYQKAPALLDTLGATIVALATRPKIAGATINTTPASGTKPVVSPTVRVVVQNPLARAVQGKLIATVAGERIRGEAALTLPPRGTQDVIVGLSEVPADFSFARFDWTLALETEAGRDELRDTVDVERALIYALRHLQRTQQHFPDGRISHHYFGDAYGVRAMLAYPELLRRQPARLQRNADLWRTTSPAALEAAGQRFFDMLAARQQADGAIPMGYAEDTAVYNVADGGQMAISVGQIVPLITDPVRRENYLTFCRRFLDWAETFYIDEKRSTQLAEKFPERAKKGETRIGHYGLGWGFLSRNETGPYWVLADILGAQALITHLDPNPDYRRIFERNLRAYLDLGYGSVGYFHAEALVWAYLTVDDAALRGRIAENLKTTFLAELLKGEANDMYTRGARTFLKGLPLLYYRRFIADDANVRAALFKYVWSFASEDAPNAMRRVAETFPKPAHGESIAAAKQAAAGAIWALELLEPGASLLRSEGFPRARGD